MFNFLKIFPFALSRFVLHILYIFPVRKNRIMFESYGGKGYTCNPKYISAFLYEEYPERFKIIWAFIKPENIQETYFQKVRKNSLAYYYKRFTSAIIITNVANSVYIPKRKNQILINTWHAGGAYKRVGEKVGNGEDILTKWQVKEICKDTDVFISSSKIFTKYNIKEGYGFNKKIIDCGMPRNDIFFDESKKSKAIRNINEHFKINNKILVLYAPTFRNSHNKENDEYPVLPVKRIIDKIEEEFNKECVLFVRSHYYATNLGMISDNDAIVNVTDYPDMQELLIRADILITDYSSCMWDYCLLGKPCFIFAPDIDNYEIERGFFTSPTLWPGIICKNADELVCNLNKKNYSKATEIAKNHLAIFGSYERGIATRQVVDYILDVSKNE